MWEFISRIFDPTGYPPRWNCGPAWAEDPWVGWLHICSDLATFAAYYSVPFVVFYFVAKQRTLKFPPVFYVFLALVFFSCGTVHLIEAGIFYWPVYRAAGLAKLLTAVVSCIGVVVLAKVLPKALELKSPEAFQREVAERKKAETLLDFERNLLHTLMTHLPDAIYFKDKDSRFLRISRAHSEKFGLPDPEAAVGKTDADFFTDDHADQAQSDERQIMETGQPLVNVVEKETWPDGRETWVSTTKAPLRNRDDELIGTFGISHDVTEIKTAERRLADVAAKLALPRQASHVDRPPIRLSDFSLRDMISCGDDIRAMSIRQATDGAFANRLVRYLYDRVVDEHDQRAFALVRLFQLRSFDELDETQQRIARQFAGNAELKPDTKCLTLMGTAGDVAAWNHVEQSQGHRAIPLPSVEAVEQLPMISQLIRQMGFDVGGIIEGDVGDIVKDAETGVFHVHEARGCDFIPAQDDFVIPHDILSVLGFGDVLPSGHLFALIGFSKVRVPLDLAHFFSHLSISTKLALLAYGDADRRVESQIVVVDQLIRNYEEVVCSQEARLGEMMDDLVRTRDAAEAANRAKSDFLANMSHEIRTPMNAVIGLTELVLDTELPAKQRDYLATVLESGESLLSIINEILDFSKIEAGKIELESIPFSLREELGDTMKSLAIRAHRKDLELAWHAGTDVPDTLAGDPNRLRQIMMNLAGNAIKFTEEGEVVLDVRLQSRTDDFAEVHFSVRDTGIGIPKNKLASVFGAFEQADSSTTRQFGGTGLGLTIASTLVELMDGRIWVESESGRGSTFHFTARFGVRSDAEVAALAPGTQTMEGMPVLVVDDNATNRFILTEILGNWRMKPTAVASGSEALDTLLRMSRTGDPFPLVLTDINMPNMDGYTLAARIRETTAITDTIIIALTSSGRTEDVERRRRVGMAAELLKPVKQSELMDAITAALVLSTQEIPAAKGDLPDRMPASEALDVLLAEDGISNQKLAIGLLENWGHRVTVANNGAQAVDLWSGHAFDLVLMDVQMPDMDGLEATRIIRHRERQTGRHTPIVAMTAHALKGDRDKCLAAGMDGYVSKPVRMQELYDALKPFTHQAEQPTVKDPPVTLSGSTVNWDAALDAVGGDEQLLKEVAREAVGELSRLAQQLGQAIEDADAPVVHRMAHTIKGVVRVFGAERAGQLAEKIEVRAKDGDLEDMRQQFDELHEELGDCIAALDAFVAADDDMVH